MKIYDQAPAAAETAQTQDVWKLRNSNTGKSDTRSADASRDRLGFSGNLGQLARTLSTYDTSRANRVQALAAQYQSGNYRPDSVATSRGMVSEALGTETQ